MSALVPQRTTVDLRERLLTISDLAQLRRALVHAVLDTLPADGAALLIEGADSAPEASGLPSEALPDLQALAAGRGTWASRHGDTLYAPIEGHDRRLGGLLALRRRPARFGPADLEVLVQIASQAAPALAGALAVEAAARRASQTERLVALSERLAAVHPPAAIAAALGEALSSALGASGRVILFDATGASGDELRFGAAAGGPATLCVALEGDGVGRGLVEIDTPLPDSDLAVLWAAAGIAGRALARSAAAADHERRLQQLIQREKLDGMARMAASVAHEINNPLQALQNTLHLLRTRPLDDEKRARYLALAQDEVDGLVTTVQRLLEFYRPTPDGLRPLAPHEILEGVLALLEPQLRRQGIALARQVPEVLPRIAGNAGQLRQLFTSLATNAAEAMPSGGVLTVRAEVDPGSADTAPRQVVIAFADTGEGLGDEELRMLFEPFFSRKENRRGLSLAICHSIVAQHGGTLTASTSPAGTTFRVALPALAR
jgi:two-component system NtrC family sensor kinase